MTNFRENILKNTEKPLKNNKKWRNCAAYNSALAKCGAENPNWKARKIIRKKLFNFVFFLKFTSLKKHFARAHLSWTFSSSNSPHFANTFSLYAIAPKICLNFWILIRRKSEKKLNENLTKLNRKNIYLKTKNRKKRVWKIVAENLQTEKNCYLSMRKKLEYKIIEYFL